MKRLFLLSGLTILLNACSATEAPVVNGWQQPASEMSDYRVQPDDTLCSIADSYGMNCDQLARVNHLSQPYNVQPGQILHMSARAANLAPENTTAAPTAGHPVVSAAPAPAVFTANTNDTLTHEKPKAVSTPPAATPAKTAGKWLWPTHGAVAQGFSGSNQGLDISGTYGQPIMAVAAGKVVYAGSSMPGYGNLIIIKHNNDVLSAYAWNKSLLVKEGDTVTAGQTIAAMGKNDTKKTVLHFEIRKEGTPVDPIPYLR